MRKTKKDIEREIERKRDARREWGGGAGGLEASNYEITIFNSSLV